MSRRLWEDVERPAWTQEQAARLEKAREKERKYHEDWCKEERERQNAQHWQSAEWSWDWQNHCWKWEDLQEVGGWWSAGKWSKKSKEPTARTQSIPAGLKWKEDEDPQQISVEKVYEDMGKHRRTTYTPLSFQPMRHITMILGRPVVVLM